MIYSILMVKNIDEYIASLRVREGEKRWLVI